MTQNAISINILSNVREAVSGVSDVGDAVDDVDKQLRDLTKEGSTSTDRMEADFRSVAKAADRSSDQLRDKFRAAYRDVRSSSNDAADDIVKDQRHLAEKSQEVGQEIRQNLGEGLANAARGDFSQLSDTIGDTLGGITASIGGIGTAALGIVGAVGLGAILAAFQQQATQADELKKHLSDLYQPALDSGQKFLDQATIIGEVQDIINNPDRASDKNRAQEVANRLGLDAGTIYRAMAGDAQSSAAAQAAAQIKVQDAAKQTGETHNAQQRQYFARIEGQAREDADYLAKFSAMHEQMRLQLDETSRQTDAYWRDQIRGSGDVLVEFDKVGNKLVTLSTGTQVLISADTGLATDKIDAFQADAENVKRHVDGQSMILNADPRPANDAIDQVSGRLNGLGASVFRPRVEVDFSDFDRKWAEAQRKAAQGLNVGVAFRGRLID